jgi:peptide/nickel transport system permease protein
VLSRFLCGGRSIIGLSICATIVGVAGGLAVGLLSGYLRNWLDDSLMLLMDALLAFPSVVFGLLLVTGIGPELWLLVIAIGVTHIPKVSRIARAATGEIVNMAFVEAAEARGEGLAWLLTREILPNIAGPMIVEASLRLTFSISIVASLSFLGFGVQPPTPDWGLMIHENASGFRVQPYSVLAPIAAIAILTIGTNLFSDGVSRALARVD